MICSSCYTSFLLATRLRTGMWHHKNQRQAPPVELLVAILERVCVQAKLLRAEKKARTEACFVVGRLYKTLGPSPNCIATLTWGGGQKPELISLKQRASLMAQSCVAEVCVNFFSWVLPRAWRSDHSAISEVSYNSTGDLNRLDRAAASPWHNLRV